MIDLSNPIIAYSAVFIAGAAASLNPCVIVVYPLIISYVGGYSDGKISTAIWDSLFFIIGLSITYSILGTIAALTGTLIGDIGGYWKYLLGATAIFFGLNLLNILKLNFPAVKMAKIKQKGVFGALLLGVIFGFTASACSTPILGLVLAFVASQKNILYGSTLLFSYAMGTSIIVLAVGISTGFAQAGIKVKRLESISNLIPKAAGIIFVLIGIWFVMFT